MLIGEGLGKPQLLPEPVVLLPDLHRASFQSFKPGRPLGEFLVLPPEVGQFLDREDRPRYKGRNPMNPPPETGEEGESQVLNPHGKIPGRHEEERTGDHQETNENQEF